MSRALAVVTACLLLCARTAGADAIDQNVKTLTSDGAYKVRLAAALALSKSKDARAVIAIADAVQKDDDAFIRRVSALALEKMVDPSTPDDAKQLALDALDRAARSDPDAKVKATAAATLKALAPLRKTKKSASSSSSSSSGGNTPAVFVNIDTATDQSKKAPKDAPDRVKNIVKKSIEKTGYSTSWPGGLPTSAELSSNKARAYIVASTVKKIEITRGSRQTTIACTVAIRIAPWTGKDGGEKWEADKAASASGSAKAMTGNSDKEVNGGMRDCIDAVAEDVTNRQVVPFLKRLAQSGS